MTTSTTAGETAPELRARLALLADAMIPAAHGMPAATEVGVHEGQLDRVLAARPDIVQALGRALARDGIAGRELVVVDELEADDPEAHQALMLAVVGGYYIHPEVRKLIGYTGQVPVPVRIENVPYFTERLLEPVEARGPIYRPVPEDRKDSE
jgi:hypothetical protein